MGYLVSVGITFVYLKVDMEFRIDAISGNLYNF